MMKRPGAWLQKGLSLVEVMVGMVILSICLIFTAASITQSRKALNQAEFIQVGTAYATNLIEETKAAPPPAASLPLTDCDKDVTVGKKCFHVIRSIYLKDSCGEYSNQQIIITVTWNNCAQPLVFSEIIFTR